MLDNELKSYLLPNLFNAAVRAGAAIMQVYKNKEDYDISIKSDKTPITVADRRAHETIKTYLGPTRIPILSEEGREMRYEERCNWELFWLVDIQYRMMSRSMDFVCPDLYIQRRFLRITDVNRGMC